jgi:crotonobetainyl-CoA:carnitine CoA-transferase CaiB-like acyl-CoA transferase
MKDKARLLPLSGLNVIEISSLECVTYAALLLSQLGGEVVKIEGINGDPLRRRPPFSRAIDGSADSLSIPFSYFNAGKRLATYDDRDDASVERVRAQLISADVVLVDHETLRDLQLELPPRRSGQVRVFVGLYGGSAQHSVQSSALTRLHASTSGYLIPADAEERMRPAWPGPYVFECMHGVGIAVATLAERDREDGGELDYSLQSYGLWLDKLLFSRTSTSGVEFHRTTTPYPYGGNLACSDGFVSILVLEERQWRGLCRMVGQIDWLTDERFATGVLRNRNRAPIAAGLAEWCKARPVEEVLEAARQADVPAGRCRSPKGVLSSPVAADRSFFASQKLPIGDVKVPTLPFGRGFRGRVYAGTGSES